MTDLAKMNELTCSIHGKHCPDICSTCRHNIRLHIKPDGCLQAGCICGRFIRSDPPKSYEEGKHRLFSSANSEGPPCVICNKPVTDYAAYEKNGAHVECARNELYGTKLTEEQIATTHEAVRQIVPDLYEELGPGNAQRLHDAIFKYDPIQMLRDLLMRADLFIDVATERMLDSDTLYADEDFNDKKEALTWQCIETRKYLAGLK